MARKIRTTEEALENTAPDAPENPDGVLFIDNYARTHVISPTKNFRFRGTRELVTDPETIKVLTALAKAGTHRIFIHEEEPAPAPTAPTAPEPEPVNTTEPTQEAAAETAS